MKRFHVHVSVENMEEGIRFYSAIFGAAPAVVKSDYAKWMLEDPRVNFAISHRGDVLGVNHLGIQVESDDELAQMQDNLETASSKVITQTGTNCCYSKSDKYWVTDPAGVAWETFHSLASVPTYGDGAGDKAEQAACCVPATTVEITRPGPAQTTIEGLAHKS